MGADFNKQVLRSGRNKLQITHLMNLSLTDFVTVENCDYTLNGILFFIVEG